MLAFLASITIGIGAMPQTPATLPDVRCVSLSTAGIRNKLHPSPALEHEVVLMPERLTDEDVNLLALALHADVARLGPTEWQLFRRDETTKQLERADREWLRSRINATVERAKALFRTYGNGPESALKALRVGQQTFKDKTRTTNNVLDDSAIRAMELTPAARLLAELLEQAPDGVVELARPGVNTTFSNVPVGEERALSRWEGPTARYAKLQERFSEWTQSLTENEVPEKYGWAFSRAPFIAGVRTLQLGISRIEFEPSFYVGVFNARGEREASATLLSKEFAALATPRHRDGPSLGKAPLPPDAVQKIAASTPDSPAFRMASLDPSLQDPLETYVRSGLQLYAKARGFDRVVACVSDNLLRPIKEAIHGNEIDLDAVATALDTFGCEEIARGKALIVRPILPLQEEATRTDRRPLAEAFRRASAGRFGFDDLCALHAGYVRNYSSTFLNHALAPIFSAFGLRELAANVPHPVLAVLGELSPYERETVLRGQSLRLDRKRHFASLPILVDEAARSVVNGELERLKGATVVRPNVAQEVLRLSKLDLTTERLLARPAGVWITGSATENTLVQRVSAKEITRTIVDGNTGLSRTEHGIGLLIDDRPVPLSSTAWPGKLSDSETLQRLANDYRFHWVRQRVDQYEFRVAGSVVFTPSAVRVLIESSKSAVPLDQVPGIQVPRGRG